MNAERLLQHYARISEAPDAIARLRRFILELAVRGKLVEEQGEYRSLTLGEIGTWGSGGTPTRTNPDFYGGTIPWLVIGDLNDGLVTEAETHITEAGLASSSAKLIDPGTIMIAMYGSIGKLGVAGMQCATNQAIAHCVPHTGTVTANYLLVLLKSLRHDLLSKGQGVAQQNISQKILKAHPISLPSLAEQRHIVAKVDELMELCDRLEAARTVREAARDRLAAASLARLNAPDPDTFQADASFALDALPALTNRPDQIKALRQTILNLAARGKLVPQDENDEPASELLSRILAVPWTKKRKLSELEPDNDALAGAFPLPSGWEWASVDALVRANEIVTYGILKPEWVADGVPTVRVTEMKTGTIDITALPKCDRARAAKFKKTTLASGDLLISKDGTIGKTAFVPPELAGGNITQHVLRFPICELVDARYVRLTIDAPFCQVWMAGETKGVALQGVNVGDFRRMPIPLPPLAEQHRIVAKADELMALCDRLEASLTTGVTARGRLFEALLADALEPALVQELQAAE